MEQNDGGNSSNGDLANTYEKLMENHLDHLAINKEELVLDFGCGEGLYTIAIAKRLEENGKIFALDENQEKLDLLETRARQLGVEQKIRIIKTDGALAIPLENEAITLTLFYNVACCILGKDNYSNMQQLIEDIHRITKKEGRMVIGVRGKTMEKRMEKVIPLIQEYFILEKKEKRRYISRGKPRYGLFFFLTKASSST